MNKTSFTILLVLLSFLVQANPVQKIFPVPQSVEVQKGEFQLTDGRIFLAPEIKSQLINMVTSLKEESIANGASLTTASALAKNELATISIIVDPKVVLNSQGYRLVVSQDGIQLIGNNAAGAFYGVQTLKQLIKFSEGGKIPFVIIQDWPDFERRGMMIDVSRNKVPTLETLKRTVDRFAEWKINEVQLYIEHTFAYKNHETVWKGYSPITAEDVIELDKYCAERFIDLVPNQNSLGHMGYWLKHDEYLYLSERPDNASSDDWIINDKRGTLCAVDPVSVDFMNELFGEYLPNFSSKFVNVGGDEPYELGTGKSAKACEERGKPVVYLDYMKKMNQLAHQYGKKTQMWGDIVNKHPELIPQMPKDITCMIWGYRPEHPFDKQCPRFQKEGIPFYVCPGTNGWRSFIGKSDRAFANIANATTNGKKYGAYGVLMTDWGDLGHHQPYTTAFPALMYGAGMSWAVAKNEDVKVTDLINTHLFFDESGKMGRALMKLTNAYKGGKNEEVVAPYFNMLNRPLENFKDHYNTRVYDMALLKDVRTEIASAISELNGAKPTSYDGKIAIGEMKTAAKIADIMSRLLEDRSKVDNNDLFKIPYKKRLKYADEMDEIVKLQAETWVLRNRIGGLHDSNSRLEDIAKILRFKDKESCTVVPRLRQ